MQCLSQNMLDGMIGITLAQGSYVVNVENQQEDVKRILFTMKMVMVLFVLIVLIS